MQFCTRPEKEEKKNTIHNKGMFISKRFLETKMLFVLTEETVKRSCIE